MSDQTEKPKGALPKGYDANTTSTENTPSTEVVKQKKINFLELVRYTSTDQDQREKDLKEYETSYIARLEKNKPEESSDDFRVELGVSTESDDDLGKLNLRKHTVTKREELQEERLAYEQKYLDRYAEPKLKKKASSSLYKPEKLKPKRNMKKERKEYEQKYISRYKQPKIQKKKASSSLYKPEKLKPKRNMKKERKEYEQKYISRYKQPKIQKKKASSSLYKPEIPKPKRDMRKERKEYEQKYLSRYKQPKPQKRTSSSLYKPEIPKPKRDMRKERKKYEQKYLSRYKQPKANLRKPLNLKSDDLGRLNLRKHTIAKRSEYLAKRKDYEEKYISRYMKKRKAEPKRSSSKNLDHDLISGRLNLRAFVDKKRREIKTERTEYEKKYISKYKESKASIKKSKSLTESDDLGKFTISTKTMALKKLRAERAEYEKQYLARYSKQRKAKPKKKVASSDLYKPEIPKPKRDIYFGKIKVDNEAKLVKSKGLYEYVNLLNPPKEPSTHLNYRLLINLCRMFKDHRIERVISKLIDYGTIKEEKDDIKELIKLAGKYSDAFLETKIPAAKLEIDDSTKAALKQLVKLLEENVEIEELQNSIYSIAKENQVQPKDFFRIIYRIIISGPRGPKLGKFIEDIGKKNVADAISRHI